MDPFHRRQLDLIRQMEHVFASGRQPSTIVPMQTDFAHDRKMALTCITHIPDKLASTIQTQLIAPLKSIEPEFYFYSQEALHLTIQNIRVVNDPPHFGPQDITKAKDVLAEHTKDACAFPFELPGLLRLPTSISIIALVSPQYDRFVKTLRSKLTASGIPDDKQYITDELMFGNITICRFTHAPSQEFLAWVETHRNMHIGAFTAGTVSLVSMNAGAHPSKTTVFGIYNFGRI